MLAVAVGAGNLPVAGVLLATLTARWTVLRALGRTL